MRAQYTCTISQARRIVVVTWVAAFLLAIPMLFTQVNKLKYQFLIIKINMKKYSLNYILFNLIFLLYLFIYIQLLIFIFIYISKYIY